MKWYEIAVIVLAVAFVIGVIVTIILAVTGVLAGLWTNT